MSIDSTVTIVNPLGLHIRPMTELTSYLANHPNTHVTLTAPGGEPCDAKSQFSLMMLGAGRGTELKLAVNGDSAQEVHDAIAAMFANGFGEL